MASNDEDNWAGLEEFQDELSTYSAGRRCSTIYMRRFPNPLLSVADCTGIML
jgi:hypothetical protein